MPALDDIIDFLLDLLRDEGARTAFEQDPQAALAGAGLQDVSADDVRDAQLLLADGGAAQPGDGGPHHAGGDDPVREISYTTQHFHAVPDAPAPVPTITIDDRDTFFVRNSVDSHDDITVIEDSFNEVDVDNSSTDNSSVVNDVVAIQDNDITTIDDSVDTTVVAVQDNDTITEVAPADDQAADDPGPVDPGADPTDGSPDPFAADPEPEPQLDPQLDTDPQLDAGDPVPDPDADIAVA